MSIECVSREALCSESKCELCYIVSAERNRLYFFLNYKFRKEKFNRWIRNQRRRLWLRQGIELMDLRISLSCLTYNWLSHQINRESNVTNMSEILIKQKKRWLKTCCCHVHVPKLKRTAIPSSSAFCVNLHFSRSRFLSENSAIIISSSDSGERRLPNQPRFEENIPSINLVFNQIYHRIEWMAYCSHLPNIVRARWLMKN